MRVVMRWGIRGFRCRWSGDGGGCRTAGVHCQRGLGLGRGVKRYQLVEYYKYLGKKMQRRRKSEAAQKTDQYGEQRWFRHTGDAETE